MAFQSESQHWYDLDGKPCYTVIGKNGAERNTTLRDARKLHLVPSVTGILNVSDKPALTNWKIDQALSHCINAPKHEFESDEAFIARIKTEAREKGMEAATIGTAIHDDLELGFKGKQPKKYNDCFVEVKRQLDELFPDEQWIAEASFATLKGYGGKIDLHSKNGIFVDFKTKDGGKLEKIDKKTGAKVFKKPKDLAYDEHGMQLSAYGAGLGFNEPVRVNVFIDREEPTKVMVYVWPDSHAHHLSMFNCLLSFWQHNKKYWPQEVH